LVFFNTNQISKNISENIIFLKNYFIENYFTMKILLHRNKRIISFDKLKFLIIFEFSDSKITKQP